MRHIKRYNQLFESHQDLTQEQRDWLDECTEGKWQVNPQTGLVDIEGNFKCFRQGLTDFKGVRFGNVSGDFDCYSNKLTSLEGSPQSVGRDFYCSRNQLTSLKGAPQSVGKDFDCSGNSLTSLEGAPLSVGGYIECFENPISGRAIEGVLKRRIDKKIPLEVAVADYWRWIPQDDRVYLAKHNPGLPDEERRGYGALGRMKTRVI